jgi:hypothetical protein
MADQDQFQDALSQGSAIAQSQAIDQQRSIPYRPEYNHITGKVTASILLQQISFRWHGHGRKPFYKFRAPCQHEKYREGDSWTEELGMSGPEFDTAIQTIGAKVTKGKSKHELLSKHLVIYWTDSDRMTWYQLNETLFYIAIYCAYYAPHTLDEGPISQLPGNLGKLNYLDNPGKPNYLGNAGKLNYIPSEMTAETSSENTSEQQRPASKPERAPPDDLNDDYARALREYEKLFGPLGGSLQYERFGDLWDEFPQRDIHAYARTEMYKAMMRDEKPVSPNLRYYAKCLQTGNQRNWHDQTKGGDKARAATGHDQGPDMSDPAIQEWLAKKRAGTLPYHNR